MDATAGFLRLALEAHQQVEGLRPLDARGRARRPPARGARGRLPSLPDASRMPAVCRIADEAVVGAVHVPDRHDARGAGDAAGAAGRGRARPRSGETRARGRRRDEARTAHGLGPSSPNGEDDRVAPLAGQLPRSARRCGRAASGWSRIVAVARHPRPHVLHRARPRRAPSGARRTAGRCASSPSRTASGLARTRASGR